MSHLFCSLRKCIAKRNNISISLAGMALMAILVMIITGCNNTPKSSRQLPGTHTTHVLLNEPIPLPVAERERLRVACESWYDSMLRSRGFQGGILVAKNGNIVYEAYDGKANKQEENYITDSTPLHIASVSKTFTAMAVLKLAQEGKCTIDDTFNTYFPGFNYEGVTIVSLLNHRSGLPNYVHFMEHMGWDKKRTITNQDILDFMITRRADMENVGTPDKRFSYCNTNFALLALLIEKLSGKSYADYLQASFFGPLKMKHTYVYTPRDSAKVMLSYDYRGTRIPLNFLDQVYGDKNIYSTPRDLLTWDRALGSNTLFNPQTLVEAYTPYSNEKPGIRNYGLGWRMNIYPSGKKMIYHNGWWHGNNAAFIRLIQDSATIIVLGNKYNRGIYHAKDLAALFGNYSGAPDEEEGGAATTATTRVAPVNAPSPTPSREQREATAEK